jgi:hypothetical protein
MAGPQRGSIRRGRNQGTLDRYRGKMGDKPALAPTLEEFMSRSGKKTLSEKDKELDVLATAARREERQADMDRKTQEAYKRFERSSENDSPGYKRGGSVKKYAKGGSVSSASKRADGCAVKGKTKGRFV